ncbi:MAG: hypothetical protein GY862_38840, partial [Gammaproteobacteria bacterium]|nr:hypothetical protein [Gammaproteobacteria bacterium]
QIVSSQDSLDEELAEGGGKIPGWLLPTLEKLSTLKQCAAGTTGAIIEQMRQAGRALVLVLPQAFGNPDARVGHTRTDGTICGYRSGFLVDAKHFIITDVVFIALGKPEAPTVVTALEKHYAIFGKHPKQLGLDSAFDRDEVHLYTEKHSIYSGVTVRSRPGAAGVYHADAFIWNDTGQLLCPAGAEMVQAGGPYKDGTDRYRAAGECSQCPDVNQCMT